MFDTAIGHPKQNLNTRSLHFQHSNSTMQRFWHHNLTQRPTCNFEYMEIARQTLRVYHVSSLASRLDTAPNTSFWTFGNCISNSQTLLCSASESTIGDNTQHVCFAICQLHVQCSYSTMSCFWRRNLTQHRTCNFEHLHIAFPACKLYHAVLLAPQLYTTPKCKFENLEIASPTLKLHHAAFLPPPLDTTSNT